MVWRYRTDLLLLSGRPSRLPAVRDCLREAAILPPHRIVLPLHLYRVGQWYPFRDYQATIADPKTTACVGAMLCLLGEGQLQNFNFRSDELKPQSTARFFGKLDRNNRLLKADEYYDNLDLDDPDYELPHGVRLSRADAARLPAVPGGLVAEHAALQPRLRQSGGEGGETRRRHCASS